MYFPGNYRWSSAFINMMGSASYGGSDIGELHKIGMLLKGAAPDDDNAWFEACAKVADGVRAHAEGFEKSGHRVSAAATYLRACHYYQMAERFRTPKDDKALKVFRQGVECFHRHAKLTDVKIEIVEVPMGKESLPVPDLPRRRRRANFTRRRAGALQCIRIQRQNAARVHRRRGRLAALPARLPDAGRGDDVGLV
jgi:hypothetical protein